MNKWKNGICITFKHFFLIITSVIFAFPFVWMLLGIFKTNNEIWQQPYKLLPAQWNLSGVLESLGNIHFSKYIFNSFYVGIFGTLFMILAATLFTYVIVFMKDKNTDLLFVLVLGTYMLPSAVTYVPSYVILARIGMLDKLNGLIFSNLASVFAVFYLRQSFKKMSSDYVEAARIDGAGHLKILRHVVFPLNKSAFYTVFVLTFVQQYNNYMWPSIMLKSEEKYLVSQGLRQFFIQDGAYGMNWSEVMLASAVTILPVIIVFLICQKWFMTGIMQDSGLK
ncbi:carbohydrate ABC transporter permease [Clostridium sediminicola]|uniref:carbohydrate ABC transporter permease n=1 Tax=Clostridium sediminicola TaxID=3114879 RepID=UPI0031F25572